MEEYEDIDYMIAEIEKFIDIYSSKRVGYDIRNRYENTNPKDYEHIYDIYTDVKNY